jgi:hypothetical protein
MLLVRPDLGLHVESAQKGERATGDGRAREIEMQCDLAAAAQVHAARNMKQTRELGETIAIRIRRDLGQLVPQLLRE